MFHGSRKLVGLLVLVLVSLGAASRLVAESPVDGHWEGAIEIPGSPLAFDVDFASDDGTLAGDISIPAQGAKDLGLVDVALDGTTVTFAIPGIPGEPSFSGTLEGDEISGTFTQGGGSLAFAMTRGAGIAAEATAALGELDAIVEKAITDFNVPGVAVGVVAGDEIVVARGWGHRDLENELPVTGDTLFAIGSTTKAFTVTLLGMLVDAGDMDWDAPLRTYLPTFALQDPVANQLISPRDLVTHRSGLPRHDLVWYNNNDTPRADMVARLAHLPPSADFRQKFQYNNLLFMTAGYLAGQLSGSSWEAMIRERILDPLGMSRTTSSVAASQRDDDHALPYRENDDDVLEAIPFRVIDAVGPAGSLNSSVTEMSQWIRLNLGGGEIDGRRLIEAATLADIHSPHMTTGESPDRPDISQSAYGMGWGVDTFRGHRRVAHGGGIDGFITSVMLFPDADFGIVVFTNTGSALPALLAQTVADRVLGLEPVDWLGDAVTRMKQAETVTEEAEKKKGADRVEGTRPSRAVEAYVGSYWHPGYGALEVVRHEDRGELGLAMVYNGITAPMEHWHYDVWNGADPGDGDPTFEDTKIQFRANVDGLVSGVEATLEVTVDPIVFARQAPARLSDPVFLARLAGRYQLSGQIATISVAGDRLVVDLPGQPRYSLRPDVSGRFVLEEVSVIQVSFEIGDEGPATGITFHQPNGVFEATRIE